jgi:hypothetical protein
VTQRQALFEGAAGSCGSVHAWLKVWQALNVGCLNWDRAAVGAKSHESDILEMSKQWDAGGAGQKREVLVMVVGASPCGGLIASPQLHVVKESGLHTRTGADHTENYGSV